MQTFAVSPVFVGLFFLFILVLAFVSIKKLKESLEDFALWMSLKPIGGGALLGTLIDSRTSTAITSGNSATFAHGLPLAPDLCVVVPNASLASTTNWWNAFGLTDATNVTLYNAGAANTPAVLVTTIRFHSIVR